MPEVFPKQQVSWRQAVARYFSKSALIMLLLGLSAGLPFLLVFSTLTAWLNEFDLSKSAIGFFAWVGITYSVKVFWAPIVDHLRIPFLTLRMGKRRSWLLIAQLGVASGLAIMASINPSIHLVWVAITAVWVAFSSATQDIVVDAFRIELADDSEQGVLSTTYITGYRLALLIAGAGALFIADGFGWSIAYLSMALLMAALALICLALNEPKGSIESDRVTPFTMRWARRALIDPFTDFIKRNGSFAIVLLAFVGLFRLSDITMGIMANPFYLDLGFTKSEIASITKVYGFAMTLIGSFAGGVLVVKYGLHRPLLAGAIFVALTNLLFAQLALIGADLSWLAITISADNFFAGFASAVFIAYLSSLTNRAYTATQYALFSSFMTLPGKFVSGFSGVIVDAQGYVVFFVYAAAMGIPAILLAMYILRREYRAV